MAYVDLDPGDYSGIYVICFLAILACLPLLVFAVSERSKTKKAATFWRDKFRDEFGEERGSLLRASNAAPIDGLLRAAGNTGLDALLTPSDEPDDSAAETKAERHR